MTNNTKKIIIGVLLLSILGLLYLNYKNTSDFKTEKAILLDEKAQVINELNKMELDFTQAIEKNTELSEELIMQKNSIVNFKDSVKRLKKTNWKLIRFYKNKIENLNTSSTRLLRMNDSLSRRNAMLNVENQDLYEDKTALTQQTKDLTTQKETLENNLKKQNTFNDTLVSQNLDLSKKIALAEMVKASGFKVTSYRESSGRYKESTRARRVDLLKASFLLVENPIAKEKDITAHIVIKKPDGSILNKKGSFVNTVQQEIIFSEISVIPFNKTALLADIAVEVNEKLMKGKYVVDFYISRKKIATVTQVLK